MLLDLSGLCWEKALWLLWIQVYGWSRVQKLQEILHSNYIHQRMLNWAKEFQFTRGGVGSFFFSPPSFFINWTWVFFPPGVCLQVLSTACCYTHLCHPLCSDWILLWLLQPFKSNSYLLYIPKYVDVIFFCYSDLLHDSWFKCPQPCVAPASFSE